MPLNTDQKRFLTAALIEIEEHLIGFERLLQAKETQTIFRRVPNPFTPEQLTKLLGLIDAFKERLREIRDTFDLPTEVVDLHWHLTVTLLHFATNLEECQSQRIKGFGKLDEETAKRLDSYLQSLVEIVKAIRQEAKNL